MDIARFTHEDWHRTYENWSAWWEGTLDRPLVVLERDEPNPSRPAARAIKRNNEFMLNAPVDDFLDIIQTQLRVKRYYGDAFPKWWLNFGPGIMAGFLGSKVHIDKNTTWFDPPQAAALADLHPTYDPENVWWRRICDLSRRAVERWGDQVCVSFTDIGGNLDILASLRGTENLLMDLHDQPQEVERLVGELTQLWLRYYDELYAILQAAGRGTTPWAPIWSPKRCYMTQCDFAYMIAPAHFQRFVVPDIQACSDHMEHCFYHLDGVGQIPHLDPLLKIKNLRGVQWIPGAGQPEADGWLDLLSRIIAAGKRCQVYLSVDGARRIVRELGGKGFVLALWHGTPRQEAMEFVREVGAG